MVLYTVMYWYMVYGVFSVAAKQNTKHGPSRYNRGRLCRTRVRISGRLTNMTDSAESETESSHGIQARFRATAEFRVRTATANQLVPAVVCHEACM